MIGSRQTLVASFVILAPSIFIGCTSVRPDAAFLDVQRTVTGRTGQNLHWIPSLAKKLCECDLRTRIPYQ